MEKSELRELPLHGFRVEELAQKPNTQYGPDRSCSMIECTNTLSRYNPGPICYPCGEKADEIGTVWIESKAFRGLSSKQQEVVLEFPRQKIGIALMTHGEEVLLNSLRARVRQPRTTARTRNIKEGTAAMRSEYKKLTDFCTTHGIAVTNAGHGKLWRRIVCLKNQIAASGLTLPG